MRLTTLANWGCRRAFPDAAGRHQTSFCQLLKTAGTALNDSGNTSKYVAVTALPTALPVALTVNYNGYLGVNAQNKKPSKTLGFTGFAVHYFYNIRFYPLCQIHRENEDLRCHALPINPKGDPGDRQHWIASRDLHDSKSQG